MTGKKIEIGLESKGVILLEAKKYPHKKIPEHMGGTNFPENIEYLTAEEHAIAHWKLYIKYSLGDDLVKFNKWKEIEKDWAKNSIRKF